MSMYSLGDATMDPDLENYPLRATTYSKPGSSRASAAGNGMGEGVGVHGLRRKSLSPKLQTARLQRALSEKHRFHRLLWLYSGSGAQCLGHRLFGLPHGSSMGRGFILELRVLEL